MGRELEPRQRKRRFGGLSGLTPARGASAEHVPRVYRYANERRGVQQGALVSDVFE